MRTASNHVKIALPKEAFDFFVFLESNRLSVRYWRVNQAQGGDLGFAFTHGVVARLFSTKLCLERS